jgi:hypothetical protein
MNGVITITITCGNEEKVYILNYVREDKYEIIY